MIDPPCGRIHGLADSARGVSAFLGIPFAAPPVGPLRWRPPQRLARWRDARDATRPGPRCPQHAPYGELEPDSPGMSEDCLYLNVWTPEPSARGQLPVIFWIHGGEFWAGSGSEPRYDGTKLAARGIVVVTINHRLGVYGFLSHPELSRESGCGTSGNYGLLDQIAALDWVIENIATFGGDPGCITIAGESAGSCSVSALMASPLAQGKFHRAIGQSCAYFMPEPHAMKPVPHAENERRGVDFMHAAGADALGELRAMPAQHLLDTWLKDTSKRMQPCIDERVLPDVARVFADGGQARVPLLCGWNGDEYGFMRAAKDRFDADGFRKRVESAFGEDADALTAMYDTGDALDAATNLTSDRTMVWPTWKWAEAHRAIAPTFVYQFDRAPPGSTATHASEIEYVFGTLNSKPKPYTRDDSALSERIGDAWVNFATHGDPNGGRIIWPSYGADRTVLHLDSQIVARPLHGRARLEFLDRLYAATKSA